MYMTIRLRHALAAVALLSTMSCGAKSSPDVDASPSAVSEALNAAGPLLSAVGASVPGLTQAQQILGLGSIFGFAKQKMTPDKYSEVATAVPGADALAAEAMNQGLPKNAKSLSDVTNFLGGKGVTPTQTSQMITVIGESMKGKINPETATTFFNTLR